MTILRTLLTTLGVIVLLVVASAPIARYHRTRPKVHCNVPSRDYEFHRYSQHLTSLSRVALLIGDDGDPQRDTPMKVFEFSPDSRLVIDHCSISKMSVVLHKSGRWTVSLRANQNPVEPLIETDLLTLTDQLPQTVTTGLQRNQFYVKVRCYAGYGLGDDTDLLGKPFVIPLKIDPFWVQKEQPYQLFKTGADKRIADYFNLLDRAEIEFYYRKH